MFTTSIIYHRHYNIDVTPKEKSQIKREATSIKIDPELWKETKIEAIRRDQEVSVFVEDTLRKELGKEPISGTKLQGGKLKGGKL